MNFSSHVEELMKPFIKSFGKCDKAKLSKEDTKTSRDIIATLYKDIYESSATLLSEGCFNHKLLKKHVKSSDDAGLKVPREFKSRYFPVQIQTYISKNELYQIEFVCGNVGGRVMHIYFTLFNEDDLKHIDTYVEQVQQMYIWLKICAKYASKSCTNTLDIYIYPTPFTKNLPTSSSTVIGPEHVNTAFTFACMPQGQLIIFREEEWFKVFIHETFHAYGLDFATTNNQTSENFKKKISDLFPINSEFDLYEAYTETWARCINCAFSSFNALTDKKNIKVFHENFQFCIELERTFALYQCVKILSFMGLQYHDLHSKNRMSFHHYKENTHVFAYYVMTALFLNDYEGFILWCRKNNSALLKFAATEEGFDSFFDYIKSIYKCTPLENSIDEMGKLLTRTRNKHDKLIQSTRMSLIQ